MSKVVNWSGLNLSVQVHRHNASDDQQRFAKAEEEVLVIPSNACSREQNHGHTGPELSREDAKPWEMDDQEAPLKRSQPLLVPLSAVHNYYDY